MRLLTPFHAAPLKRTVLADEHVRAFAARMLAGAVLLPQCTMVSGVMPFAQAGASAEWQIVSGSTNYLPLI